MLENVTLETTIGELTENKKLEQVSDYLFTHMTDDVYKNTVSHYDNHVCGIMPSLERICEITEAGKNLVYDVYSEEQIAGLPELNEVKVIHFPGDSDKPFVLVCPGGGYAREWVLVEGYPVAEQLNRMGYTAFILIYRTGQTGLLPKPLDDMAQALAFILKENSRFRVQTDNYAVAGFSAGGHLVTQWGTKENGYLKYGLKKPGALFLGYPGCSTDVFYESLQGSVNPVYYESMKKFLERIGGTDFTKESLRKYSAEYQMDHEYPATYLVHCQDDPVVPVESSYVMKDNLTKHQIRNITRFPERGGHSFGIGNGTGADGWLKEAVSFWEQIREKEMNATE